MSLKVIEHSRERAEFVSRELGNSVVVVQGDALDKDVLLEAHVQSAETIIAVTNDALGIDTVVSPNAITISTILRHVRHRAISALYTLRKDFGEVIEATAP